MNVDFTIDVEDRMSMEKIVSGLTENGYIVQVSKRTENYRFLGFTIWIYKHGDHQKVSVG